MIHQKHILFRILCSIAILLASVASITSPVKAQSKGLDLFYNISVAAGVNTVHVEIQINNLSSNQFNLGFSDLSEDIHDYVSNLSVDQGAGTSTIQYTALNTWTITTQKRVSTLIISYDIAKEVPFSGNLAYAYNGQVLSVLINDMGGLLIARYFFLVPLGLDVESIKGSFEIPSDWKLVSPYVQNGTSFEVPKITNHLVKNFVQRGNIYFGKMRFYSEKAVDNSMVKFGVLEMDHSPSTESDLSTQQAVDLYTERTALAVQKFTEIFGENPYPVFANMTNFAVDFNQTKEFSTTSEVLAGYQYWPPSRFDELIGHMQYSWLSFNDKNIDNPLKADEFIAKGLGESYLADKIAYELTGDNLYLGKIYTFYLVYKRALGTQYMSLDEVNNSYYKGSVFALYLDHLIQSETNNQASIEDVFGALYKKYKNSGHVVSKADLEAAVNAITNQDNSDTFNRYVFGNEEIPVEDIIQPYRQAFGSFINVLQSNAWYKEYLGYEIPFFVDIEMALALSRHIPMGLLIDNYYQQFADYVLQNYDINNLTKEDVESALTKLTGKQSTGFFDRWEDCYGELSLEEMKAWLNSYSVSLNTNSQIDSQNNGSSLPNSDIIPSAPTPTNAPLINLAIRVDGLPIDWPSDASSITNSSESGTHTLKALTVFSKDNYLYLRIDPEASFSTLNHPQFLVNVLPVGDPQTAYQIYTLPNDLKDLSIAPIHDHIPQYKLQKVFSGVGINKVVEMAIPLEYLGSPQKLILKVFVIDRDDPSKILDSLDAAEFSMDTGKLTVTDLPDAIVPSTTTAASEAIAPHASSPSFPPGIIWIAIAVVGVAFVGTIYFLLRKRKK